MSYHNIGSTRQKKDAKRTVMMKAAMRVFAEKGYYAATVRDIVRDADVAIGTFYFYFPDKESLFVHLYEETADFLLQAIDQAVKTRVTLPHQLQKGIRAYVNIAMYEPAVVHLLLVGGVGAVPSLTTRRAEFRGRLVAVWQRPLETALSQGTIPPQNCHRIAEAFAGAFDEVVLNLLTHPEPDVEANTAVQELTLFAIRAVAYTGSLD
ncbi:MAG: TetR/AcrR family transcriptional regulator [Chloroflexi bacterium]|nr:TetR/AcrR family transcriptional regulator [Chloroflexota bacterium]